jgi:hypothetical protein
MTGPGQLTSWKEIAAYLGRDVRTVMRWEKERGLPVHRGPGRKGIVFATPAELDAWTRGTPPASADPVQPRRLRRWWLPLAVLPVVVTAAVWVYAGRTNTRIASVVLTGHEVVARRADGTDAWRYSFGDLAVAPPTGRSDAPAELLGSDGVLTATVDAVRRADDTIHSGELLWFDRRGAVRRRFSFDGDRWTFAGRVFSGPWALADYQVRDAAGSRRIAVTARHYDWWPSLVTVLDAGWTRQGTFVNAGWVDLVRWIGDDRLALAGFFNPGDGGMVALLDARHMNGQSPAGGAAEFVCAACGPDRPLRYVVMPRSEVNRAAAAPFNRAVLSARSGGFVAQTLETTGSATSTPATALYEFSRDLELTHAAYTARYWEVHRELEQRGVITHDREHCPERDGPPRILVWEPATGWRTQPAGAVDAGRRAISTTARAAPARARSP